MDGRNGILFVCMFLLAATGVGQYYWRLNDKNQDLADYRVLLSQAKNTLQSKESIAAARQRSYETGRLLSDHYKSLAEEHANLTKEVHDLDAQFIATEKQFVDAVVQVRKQAAEQLPVDIVLKSGLALSGARVQKVSHTDVMIQHSGGVTRVDAADLPPDLLDKFRHNTRPFGPGGAKDPATPSTPHVRGGVPKAPKKP
jgi:hypothetical protein